MISSWPTFFFESNLVCDYYIGNWPIAYNNDKLRKLRKHWLTRSTPYTHHKTAAIFYGLAHRAFQENKDMINHSILYEDLNSNPLEEAKKLLQVIGLNQDLAGEACKALENDSQNGILGQRGKGSITITDQMKVEIDAALKECGSNLSFASDINVIRQRIQVDQ